MKIICFILLAMTTLPSYASIAYFNATDFSDIFVFNDHNRTITPEVSASGSLTYHLDPLSNLVLDDFSMITHSDTFTFDPSTYGAQQNGVGSSFIGMNVFGSSYAQLAFLNVQDFSLEFNYDSVTGTPVSFGVLAFAEEDGTVAWASDNVQLSNVPVPSAIWLMGSGLLGLLGYSRKISQVVA